MNKSYLLLAIITCILVGSYVYYNQTKSVPGTQYRIALFEPAIHAAMDEIVRGFEDTMNAQGTKKYEFKRYNANGNSTLLRAQAEEIINQQYDLVMSIGTDTTRTLHELTTKKQIRTPIVFCAITNPVEIGVVASLQSSENNVTGIQDTSDYDDQLTKLLALKPGIKTITLVYDPLIKGGIEEKDAQTIDELAQAKNIRLQKVQIFHPNEIQAKVQALLPTTDVVMILTDHTVITGIDTLITLCNRYQIPLYTSDLNSGDKGAALSYGVIEYDYGVEAAQKAISILEHKKRPADLPISAVAHKKMKVRLSALKQQGMSISAEQEETLKREGGIIE